MNPDDKPRSFDAYMVAMNILEDRGPLRLEDAKILAREYQRSVASEEAQARVVAARAEGRQQGLKYASHWLLVMGSGNVPRDAAALRCLDYPKGDEPVKPPKVYVPGPDPMVLVLSEKHGRRHFLVKSDSDLFSLALQIVKERAAWYEEPVSFDDGRLAWEFLFSRRDGEYENVALKKFDRAP